LGDGVGLSQSQNEYVGFIMRNAMPKRKQPASDMQFMSPEKYQEAIRELVAALELCLKCDGLSWEAEREADILVARYKE